MELVTGVSISSRSEIVPIEKRMTNVDNYTCDERFLQMVEMMLEMSFLEQKNGLKWEEEMGGRK